METIYYGSTPYGEECAQVGTDDYTTRARRECSVYIEQLTSIIVNAFGEMPKGLWLRIKGENHDYGTYYEVVGVFHDDDPKAVEVAYWLEDNSPETWDDSSKQKLVNCQ